MLRDKGDNLIDERELNKDETLSFIICMKEEITRHQKAINEARHKLVGYATSDPDDVTLTFWRYEITRHRGDISGMLETIEYLKVKWEL